MNDDSLSTHARVLLAHLHSVSRKKASDMAHGPVYGPVGVFDDRVLTNSLGLTRDELGLARDELASKGLVSSARASYFHYKLELGR